MSIIPAEVSGLLGRIAGLAGALPRIPEIQIRIPLPWNPQQAGAKDQGLLKAAPKKKVSHQKRRQKLYAPGKKQLKVLHNLNRCPACGHYKRSHFLCMNCVEGIRRLWCERDAEKQPPQFEQKLANPRDEKIIYPGKKITEEERKLAEKEFMQKLCLPRHPLGVRPTGNALLSSEYDITLRSQQLGLFDILPDEVILEVLGFIKDPLDLMRLGHTSRVMYAFTWTNELWRNLYLIKVKDASSDTSGLHKWRGSWRRTLLSIPNESEEAYLQCAEGILCSDILYRPFHCSMIDFNEIFGDIVATEQKHATTLGRIERLDEKKLSQAEFDSKWNDRPFILTSTSETRWPSWDLQALLDRFPDEKFRQGSTKWPLSLYHEYVQKNQDESPLYLFDCDSQAMRILRQEYNLPRIFQNDFFSVFEENGISCRPDNAWLIAGPERSGSIFHKDPNATSAWNTVLSGKKLWIMLPPDVPPPGVGFDSEESEVSSPVSLAEWVLSGYFNDARKLVSQGKCLMGVTFPGECLYVPSGWWHSVINLEDSVALTHNFVPKEKLHHVLYFLKHKPDQLSGFHSIDVRNSISAFLAHCKTLNANIATLIDFLKQSKNNEDNEDCGVVMARSGTILPIYEFFHELLSHSKFKDHLEDAKIGLLLIENKRKEAVKLKESALWNSLTENDKDGNTFSFGFDESDED